MVCSAYIGLDQQRAIQVKVEWREGEEGEYGDEEEVHEETVEAVW